MIVIHIIDSGFWLMFMSCVTCLSWFCNVFHKKLVSKLLIRDPKDGEHKVRVGAF